MKKDNNVLMHVANRFDEIRREKKIKEVELAKRVGISKNSMSAILQGNVNMSISTFYGLCSALGVNPGEVLPPLSVMGKAETEFASLKFKYMSLPTTMRKFVFNSVEAILDRFTKL